MEHKPLDLPPVWDTVKPYYSLKKKLGAGSYGEVVKAKCKMTKQEVAIKYITDFADDDYSTL